MPDYFQVSPLYWTEVSVGWSERAKALGIWLQTCQHRNLEGLYRLPRAYVTADLGWPARVVDEVFTELIGARFVEVDEPLQLVLVPACLRQQQPKSAKQVKGAINVLKRLPRSVLLERLLEVALEVPVGQSGPLAVNLAAAIVEEFGIEQVSVPPTDPPTDSRTHPDTHSDTGTDTHSDTHSDGVATPIRNTRAGAPTPTPTPTPPTEPPPAPQGGRKRDHDRFSLQVKEWHDGQLPTPAEAQRWAAARGLLSEQFGESSIDATFGNAHAHRASSERLTIALDPRYREALTSPLFRRFRSALDAALDSEYELIDCPCGATPPLEVVA